MKVNEDKIMKKNKKMIITIATALTLTIAILVVSSIKYYDIIERSKPISQILIDGEWYESKEGDWRTYDTQIEFFDNGTWRGEYWDPYQFYADYETTSMSNARTYYFMMGNIIVTYGITGVVPLYITELSKEKIVFYFNGEKYTYINKKCTPGEGKYSGEDMDTYALLRSIGWGHSDNEQLIVFDEDKIYEYTIWGNLNEPYKYEYIGDKTIAVEYEGKTTYVTIEDISKDELVLKVNDKKRTYPAKTILYNNEYTE